MRITDFKEGTYKVDIKNIVYICSDDHYLHFYLKSNDENAKQLSCLNKRGRLDDLAGKLDDSFVRVNYSHLVNMAYITSIAGGVVTVKSGDAVLQMEFTDSPKVVSITFLDGGVPYNPLEKEDPDTSLSLEERAVGGLGIFMTKNLMDDMFYEYKDGKNILNMKKTIPQD